ncbi:MAG: hypothetical protein O2968_04995 [Acidobacteria bacterium]|nr:hypothetical protein [Acidobacteriota bacterium]
MLKRVLVRELIEDGDSLLTELRRRAFPVAAAFWVDTPESDYWRLVIATDIVDKEGPDVAYRALRDALNTVQPQDLALDDIYAVSPKGDDYRGYLSVLRDGGRLRAGSASGRAPRVVFEDSYVYQVSQ